MGIAETRTLLPIDTFAKILGVNPLHFNGVYVADLVPATTCGQPLLQFAWQSANAVAREDIANAIADAEERIAQWTKFKLAPSWEVDERHSLPRPTAPEMYAGMLQGMRGRNVSIKADWGHVVSGGIEGSSVIQLAANVVYTDTDSDGYEEIASITVTTSIVDPNEIRIYYPGTNGDPAWEIRPTKVLFGVGTAVIRVRREQLVNPGLIEGFSGRAVDGLDDTQFLAQVDVYRKFHDPSQQVQFLWEGPSWGQCGCGTTSCTTCYMAAQFGCVNVRDYRLGALSPSVATWNATTSTYEAATLSVNRAPDKARLWYRAGYRDQTQPRPFIDMKPAWARAVTYFATALLARPMCSCANLEAQMSYWQDDMSMLKQNQTASENFQLSRKLLDNPFGMTRGAVHAWRVFQREALGDSVEL